MNRPPGSPATHRKQRLCHSVGTTIVLNPVGGQIIMADAGPKSLEQVSTTSRPSRTLYRDPLVLGISALVLGFSIGSGRRDHLTRDFKGLAENVGAFLLAQLTDAFHRKNKRFFARDTTESPLSA